MTLPRLARAYLWLVALTAIASLAAALLWVEGVVRGAPLASAPAAKVGVLAQLVILAVVAQHFPLSPAPKRKFDVSQAVHFATLLVGGLPLSVALVGLGEFLGQGTLLLRRHPTTGQRLRTPYSVLFNTSQFMLAVWPAGVARAALPRLWAVPAAAIAFYLANSLLVAGMAALHQRKGLAGVWLTGRGWSAAQAAGLLVIGAVAAALSDSVPWGPLAMALPAAITYLALRRTETAEAAVRARDEFISVASHELRTPMTSLLGYTQMLLREFDRDGQCRDVERTRRALHTIDAQGRRMVGLITQLLDATSLRLGKLTLQRERMDLAAVAREVAAALQPTTGGYYLALHTAGPVYVDADRLRLEQVLTNLVDNAIKYAGCGDRIDIEVAALAHGQVRLAVRDYGVGIPHELREKVFERYQQVHRQGLVGGLGIGLHVAREIVILHGGAITIEGPLDGGTRFSITLPAAAPAADAPVSPVAGTVPTRSEGAIRPRMPADAARAQVS